MRKEAVAQTTMLVIDDNGLLVAQDVVVNITDPNGINLMKVLTYGHRKEDPPTFWDASTPEKEDAAFKMLFERLRYWTSNYADLTRSLEEEKEEIQKLEKLKEQLESIPDSLKDEAKRQIENLGFLKREVKETEYQKQLYDAALKDDVKAMKLLIKLRKGLEYEEWDFIQVIDPL